MVMQDALYEDENSPKPPDQEQTTAGAEVRVVIARFNIVQVILLKATSLHVSYLSYIVVALLIHRACKYF